MIGEGSPITIGLVLAIVAGILGLWWRIEGRLNEERSRAEMIAKELSDYKFYVANNHVTVSALRDMEMRLLSTLEKLAARMETVVSRIEKLNLEMAQRND